MKEVHGVNPQFVRFCQDANQGAQLFNDLWNQNTPRPTGLVIGQHSVAESVVLMINRMKVKVPQELSAVIIGEPSWATIFTPILRMSKKFTGSL